MCILIFMHSVHGKRYASIKSLSFFPHSFCTHINIYINMYIHTHKNITQTHTCTQNDKTVFVLVMYQQLCFAPCFLGAFLGISGTLNGLTVEENVAKLKRVRLISSWLFSTDFNQTYIKRQRIRSLNNIH